MQPLLELSDLSKTFRSGRFRSRPVRAFDHVDLAVRPGGTLGLIGESGCGKTTLARCALRLLEPSSGSILFDGCDLQGLAPAALRRRRREFQMIFQDASGSLDPRMTIERILLEPLVAHGIGTRRDREVRVRELCDSVALDAALRERKPGDLSGGQQQRVVIARALALKPRLLVADEPVSALDASVQAQILNLLALLQKRFGLTLVLISHSLPVVHYLCDRIAVMYSGRIVEEAPAEELFAQPLHPYSSALISAAAAASGPPETDAPPGGSPASGAPLAGCPFHPRCPLVSDRCRQETPAPVARGRARVACFLFTKGETRRIKGIHPEGGSHEH